MGALATWIGSLFAGVAGYLAAFVSKRLAVRVLVLTVMVTLTAGLYQTLSTAMASLAVSVPQWVIIGASWVLPSNLTTVISVVVGARLARWVYDWQITAASLKAGA